MAIPFLGAEAIASGRLTRGQLRSRYRPILRGVYLPAGHQPSLRERVAAVQLAAPDAVISGLAASAIHGAKWVDDDVCIEVIGRCRPQPGLRSREDSLGPGDVMTVDGVRVTTPARTAFDIGRRFERGPAVAALDALMRAAPFPIDEVDLLAKLHPGARGLRTLRIALPLVDGGAESPRETFLRLLFVDAGLPITTTQFNVYTEDGRHIRRIDLACEEFKVGAEYDGDHHLTERRQYTKDIHARRELHKLDWHLIHVIKEDRGAQIIRHAADVLFSHGWVSPDGFPNPAQWSLSARNYDQNVRLAKRRT